jgi:nucleotide-binding universal stress UspA family protein
VEHPTTSELLPFVSIDRRGITTHSLELMHRLLDKAVPDASCRPPEVAFRPLEDAPAHSLVRLSQDANLLVVGSRGTGRLAGLRLGSVSLQSLHHSHCAVAVVPTPALDG